MPNMNPKWNALVAINIRLAVLILPAIGVILFGAQAWPLHLLSQKQVHRMANLFAMGLVAFALASTIADYSSGAVIDPNLRLAYPNATVTGEDGRQSESILCPYVVRPQAVHISGMRSD